MSDSVIIRNTFRFHDNPLIKGRGCKVFALLDESRSPESSHGYAYSFHQYHWILQAINLMHSTASRMGIAFAFCTKVEDIPPCSSAVRCDVVDDPAFFEMNEQLKRRFKDLEMVETNTLTCAWRDAGKRVVDDFFSKDTPFASLRPIFEYARQHIRSQTSFEAPSKTKKAGRSDSMLRAKLLSAMDMSGSRQLMKLPFDTEEEVIEHCLNALSELDTADWSKPQTDPDVMLGCSFTRSALNTSQLSPYFAIGLVSPVVMVSSMKRSARKDSIFGQLLWREAFHALASHKKFWGDDTGSRLWTVKKKNGSVRYRWHNDETQIQRWKNGSLQGLDDCNKSMRQLANTGWIHHLQRHLVASVLRHALSADWRLGQNWFRHTLIDHDAAINRANWMWLTGVAIDARARKYNGRDYIKRRSKKVNPTRLTCANQKKSQRESKGMNVLGSALQDCSSAGHALTGYTRSGSCVGVDPDAGKHHVCLNLQQTPQFCNSTGQGWCGDKMRCHDSENADCLPENWCVCQWAFADVVDAVGCDGINKDAVKCEATNANALKAYDQSGEAKHKAAADCLRRKCAM